MTMGQSGWRRLLCALVIATVCVAVGSASGGGEGAAGGGVQVSKAGLPIVSPKITLSMLTHEGHAAGSPKASNDLPVYQEYERLTSIHVDWEVLTRKDYWDSLALRLAAADLPDIINMHGAGGNITQYGCNHRRVVTTAVAHRDCALALPLETMFAALQRRRSDSNGETIVAGEEDRRS